MITEQRNTELMQTLDDAWNAQDWDTFDTSKGSTLHPTMQALRMTPPRSEAAGSQAREW
jgi:hypothetical protein